MHRADCSFDTDAHPFYDAERAPLGHPRSAYFSTMLSVPHMIVVFLVVLVVFGPQKLPELARSFGKLMAEFRKASNDFKNAFEEEMRDLERQARIAELKKQVAEANAAADAAVCNATNPTPSAPPGHSVAMTPLAQAAANSRSGDLPVVQPVPDTVPRLDETKGETEAAKTEGEAKPGADSGSNHQSSGSQQSGSAEPATENPPSHDQQQPA
jgi:sec-independent protein translocase protein TatB